MRPEQGPLTAQRLRSLWPAIVSWSRTASPMAGSLLADASVDDVTSDLVTLQAATSGSSEGLAHKRDAIAKLLGEWVSGPVRVAVKRAPESASRAPNPASPRPERLTERTANAERLKVLRAKDPTLGNAVDALDLELME